MIFPVNGKLLFYGKLTENNQRHLSAKLLVASAAASLLAREVEICRDS